MHVYVLLRLNQNKAKHRFHNFKYKGNNKSKRIDKQIQALFLKNTAKYDSIKMEIKELHI